MIRRVLVLILFCAISCNRGPAEVSRNAKQGSTTAPAAKALPEPPVASFEAKNVESAARDDAGAAVDVVRAYYRAIDSRSYDTAYRCWGTSGPPGQSLKEFAAGFSDTSSVQVMPGEPSQIGAAAGSRYVDVPVTVVATTKSGRTQRFSGTYTLQRAVVDGASPAQRKWHLYRATLRELR